jgi:carboxypeptidase C (cathepsin A)
MDNPEMTEGAIKNGQSREIGNIGYTRKTKANKIKNTTQYALDTTMRKQNQAYYIYMLYYIKNINSLKYISFAPFPQALSIAFTHSEGCLTDTATSYTERYGGLNDNTTKSVTEGEYRSNNHVAKYKGQIVYVKRLKRQKIKVDRKLLKEMKMVGIVFLYQFRKVNVFLD